VQLGGLLFLMGWVLSCQESALVFTAGCDGFIQGNGSSNTLTLTATFVLTMLDPGKL
jgi:hypothetical protein